jgi:hypothetical protein
MARCCEGYFDMKLTYRNRAKQTTTSLIFMPKPHSLPSIQQPVTVLYHHNGGSLRGSVGLIPTVSTVGLKLWLHVLQKMLGVVLFVGCWDFPPGSTNTSNTVGSETFLNNHAFVSHSSCARMSSVGFLR